MPEGRWPRGVNPRPRSGAAAESARLGRHRNGREELPHVRGQGQQLRGATQCPRPEAEALRSNPTSQEWWLLGHRRAYPTLKVRKGGGREEISLVQGKEQQLHFAGAAMKRYPMPKIRETQVRW